MLENSLTKSVAEVEVMGPREECLVVLPSLMPNGGVRETLRLAQDLETAEIASTARIVTLWAAKDAEAVLSHMGAGLQTDALPLSSWPPVLRNAVWQWPVLAWRFFKEVRQHRRKQRGAPEAAPLLAVFTHYTTLPLATFVQRSSRWFLVQDLEWLFVNSTAGQFILRGAILSILRKGRVLTTNTYLQQALEAEGVRVDGVLHTWADSRFCVAADDLPETRNVDVVMVLRRGAHKCLEMYKKAVKILSQSAENGRALRLAVITPDEQLAQTFQGQVAECLLRPDMESMRDLYKRSKCFLHLSQHEGFGLPPLEAMGAGCVPLCRDSGGVQTYMHGLLQSQLLPTDLPIDKICHIARQLVDDFQKWQRLSQLAQARFMDGLMNPLDRQRVLSSLMARNAARSKHR